LGFVKVIVGVDCEIGSGFRKKLGTKILVV